MDLGELAYRRGLEEFNRPVEEKKDAGKARIDQYIKEGLGWSWLKGTYPNYSNFGDFEWCGAFVAWAWLPYLRKKVRQDELASTQRLYTWAEKTQRSVDPRLARPGDIVLVGPQSGYWDEKKQKTYRYGKHIALVERVEPDAIATIEGNTWGTGPGGTKLKGVARNRRLFHVSSMAAKDWRVLMVIRPIAEDLVSGINGSLLSGSAGMGSSTWRSLAWVAAGVLAASVFPLALWIRGKRSKSKR